MTACGHLSQTLDGLDGARKENGGRGMEEPRASIPLDYRFLHLSFYRYKRKRKGDAEKMEVGYIKARCIIAEETKNGLHLTGRQ